MGVKIENGGMLVVRSGKTGLALTERLRRREWSNVLWEQRASFTEQVDVWLFGHALLEKLLSPYKSITAHMTVIEAPESFFQSSIEARRQWLDQAVCAQIEAAPSKFLQVAQFMPLPVSGIPGWCENQGPDFYADAKVFRVARRTTP